MQIAKLIKAREPGQKRLRLLAFYIICIWSTIVVISLFWNLQKEVTEIKAIAESIARESFFKDQAFRLWSASHGGVYVPVTKKTPPNTNLSHILDRDIQKPDGTELTLMNPAYMVRQMMDDYSGLYGIKGKITSLKYFHPGNKPDEWETKALKSFEKGEKEAMEYIEVNNKPFLRLMRPMTTEKSCLKCHEIQGYKEGDIRGGIGVSLGLQTLYSISNQHKHVIFAGHFGLWLIILGGIVFYSVRESSHRDEQIKAQRELSESEEKYTDLYDNAPDMFASIDLKTAIIINCNQTLVKMTGFSKQELIGQLVFNLYTPESAKYTKEHIIPKFLKTGTIKNEELRIQRKDGSTIDISLNASAVRDSLGNIIHSRSVWRDITQQKKIQGQIKASLKEKETLLQEIHHRVKNNMQVINSLLILQANSTDNKQAKDVLKQSQGRVYAMSAVHETLHGSEKLSEIDLRSYLLKITTMIIQTYSMEEGMVELINDVERTSINLNQAYPLGLVINELISNALKYAFPENRKGKINVSSKKFDNQVEIIVKDDGVGLPNELDWKNTDSLGLKLVRTLVEKQLGGLFTMKRKNGTEITLKFDIET